MAIEKLSVILELVSGNYKKEAKEAATATGQIGNSAKSVTGSLSAMIGPAAIGGAIVGLGKMVHAAGENADRLFDLATQTGLSTDALQEWEFVAKAAGAGTETFSDAVKQVVKSLSEAAAGTGAAADAYEVLGVSVHDASGNMRAAGDITDEVFTKLAGMTNITERNALAQDIFGKKWEETITILDLGADAIGNLRDESKASIISAESLRNADKFRETIDKLKATLTARLNESLGKIAPLLTEIAEAAGDAIDTLEPLIDVLGFIAEKYSEASDTIDEGIESENRWTQAVAVAGEAGKGLTFGLLGLISATQQASEAAKASREGLDAESLAAIETAFAIRDLDDATRRTSTSNSAFVQSLDDERGALDHTTRSVDGLRLAELRLSDGRIANLSPALSALRAIKDSAEAYKALADAQEDGKSTQAEITQLQIEAAIAFEEMKLRVAEFAITGSEGMAEFARAVGLPIEEARKLAFELGALTAREWLIQVRGEFSGFSGGSGAAWYNGLLENSGLQEFAGGGVVQGPFGSPQLIVAHGGEIVTPAGQSSDSGMVLGGDMGMVVASSFIAAPTYVTKYGPTITLQAPMGVTRQDLQYATILASVTNLVEGL